MSNVRCLSCQKWRVMNAQKPACSDVCEDKASWPDGQMDAFIEEQDMKACVDSWEKATDIFG